MIIKGWIKVHRNLIDKPIWLESTPEQKVILITLLMMANHKENEWEWKGKPYKVSPGQFITSLESIARNAGKGISIQNVRTALKRFEKYGFLTNKSTNKNRLITIVNWGFYQQEEGEKTSKLTSNQQATNKQLTSNKNVKNDKNENKKDIKTSRSKLKFETHHLKLAELLFKKIKENNSSAKEPNLESWANTFRLMMERDKRTGKDIQDLILWSQSHHFWYKNILSADKLRNQFDRLFLEMRDEKQSFRSQPKLIATEKPDHIEVPILPDDIDEQIDETLKELYGEE